MVLREAVEGVVPGGGVKDEGVQDVMQGGRLEAESGSTGVSEVVMSLPAALEFKR